MSYTRQPVHWDTDTAGRHEFEGRVRRCLRDDGEFVILDETDSFDATDFDLGLRGKRLHLEVKEKKQRYRAGWVDEAAIPEEHLFILDELAARKVVLCAPRSYVLVRDGLEERFVMLGAIELLTIPKVRVNRSIDSEVATFKGKWLIDLRSGTATDSLVEAVAYLKRRSFSEDEYWNSLACHGRYEGESVPRF